MIIPLIVTVLELTEVVVNEVVGGGGISVPVVVEILWSGALPSVLPSSFKNLLQNCPTLTVTILVSCDGSVLLRISSSPCFCCCCGLTNGKDGGEGMGSILLPDFRGRSDPSAMKAMAFK
jgi:hypothetical protein